MLKIRAIPIFAISRHQNLSLKNSTSTLIMTAIITTMKITIDREGNFIYVNYIKQNMQKNTLNYMREGVRNGTVK